MIKVKCPVVTTAVYPELVPSLLYVCFLLSPQKALYKAALVSVTTGIPIWDM